MNKITNLEASDEKLRSQVIKIETNAKKNNLILRGIAETNPNENTRNVVWKFLTDSLGILEPGKLIMSAAYRIGKPPHLRQTLQKYPRDIMLKFASEADRDGIWRLKSKLKGTKISLMEDLPHDTIERRKLMMPYYLAARKRADITKCFLNKDCLSIDGKHFYVEDIDQLPKSIQPKNPSQVVLDSSEGIAFYGKHSFLSNFYKCTFKDGPYTFYNLESYYQYKKAKYFKDEQCASRILDAKTPAKAKAIAYQIKDFDEAMWMPVAIQTMLTGCSMKFSQNHELSQRLCDLQGMIVECNPKDVFFSCGLPITHTDIENPATWKGKNVLDEILCMIRDNLNTSM